MVRLVGDGVVGDFFLDVLFMDVFNLSLDFDLSVVFCKYIGASAASTFSAE